MSSTQTEESAHDVSYDEYDDGEYTDLAVSPNGQFVDERDFIIMENQKKIQQMQKAFRKKAAEMRAELADICEQSAKLQYSMLDRILQLKEKIKEVNERKAFCKRKLPKSTKPGTKKKSVHIEQSYVPYPMPVQY